MPKGGAHIFHPGLCSTNWVDARRAGRTSSIRSGSSTGACGHACARACIRCSICVRARACPCARVHCNQVGQLACARARARVHVWACARLRSKWQTAAEAAHIFHPDLCSTDRGCPQQTGPTLDGRGAHLPSGSVVRPERARLLLRVGHTQLRPDPPLIERRRLDRLLPRTRLAC